MADSDEDIAVTMANSDEDIVVTMANSDEEIAKKIKEIWVSNGTTSKQLNYYCGPIRPNGPCITWTRPVQLKTYTASAAPLRFHEHPISAAPNVRIQVFETIFEVHSKVLVRCSSLFDNLICDIVDLDEEKQHLKAFSYKLDVAEDCLTWKLNPSDDFRWTSDKYQTNRYKENTVKVAGSLYELLVIMYGYKLIKFRSPTQLFAVIKMAEYLGCMDNVRPLLHQSLEQSPALHAAAFDHAESMLLAATQLQHAGLFRDCTKFLLGKWTNEFPMTKSSFAKHAAIQNSLFRAAVTLSRKIDTVERAITDAWASDQLKDVCIYAHRHYDVLTLYRWSDNPVPELPESCSKIAFPNYCRTLLQHMTTTRPTTPPAKVKAWDDLADALAAILESDLMFVKKDEKAGEGRFRDFLLCAEVLNDDFPWNIKKV